MRAFSLDNVCLGGVGAVLKEKFCLWEVGAFPLYILLSGGSGGISSRQCLSRWSGGISQRQFLCGGSGGISLRNRLSGGEWGHFL